jgi:hypothetical protein
VVVMVDRKLDLDELEGRTWEDVLREVVRKQLVLTVQLPEGDLVAIRPAKSLQPLPLLEGSIPAGWKDAVYE